VARGRIAMVLIKLAGMAVLRPEVWDASKELRGGYM
jgi:hypothetical protein